MALDLTLFIEPFQQLSVGDSWHLRLIPMALVAICSIAVTRNPKYIMILQLPISLVINKIGFSVGKLGILIYAIAFAMNIVKLSAVGDVISATFERGTEGMKAGIFRSAEANAIRRANRESRSYEATKDIMDEMALQKGLSKANADLYTSWKQQTGGTRKEFLEKNKASIRAETEANKKYYELLGEAKAKAKKESIDKAKEIIKQRRAQLYKTTRYPEETNDRDWETNK